MPTIDAGGVSLFYTDEGSGAPVVFVHGIPTDYRAWGAQVRAVVPKFRAIAYSRRYAAPNDRAGDAQDSTIENNARDLGELLRSLDLDRVHLVGHSYGGFIAAYFALREPARLRSLVLVEPAIASLLLKDPNSRAQAFFLLLRHPSTALSAARFLRTSNAPALNAVRAGQYADATRFNVDGVEDRSGALDSFPSEVRAMMLENGKTVAETATPYPAITPENLRSIAAPTLVVRGESGALWLRTIADQTARSIPGSQRAVIAGAGHYPHVSRPTEFNQALLGFLGQVG